MLAAVDWGAVGTLLGEVLAILAALIRLLVAVSRLEQAVKEHHESIRQNARHLDSTINAMWMLAMRVATMEEHLERTSEYHPPVIISRNPDNTADD